MTVPGVLEDRPDPTPVHDDDLTDGASSDGGNSSDTRPSSTLSSYLDYDWEFPPIEKLTVFDFLDNLALPQAIEKINRSILMRRESFKRSTEKVKMQYQKQKTRVINQIEIEKFKHKYAEGLDKVMAQWNDTKAITTREKISFIGGVSNIFITGFLVGGYPDWVHIWYTLQLAYFLPLRYITYHKKGYHYFLADLCYFVNIMLLLSIWVFPNSRRLFISTYCLAFGNNAVAIAMWRNSLVFHSLDKVTSLFIHIMPPVTLHCLVHLTDPTILITRFPAIARVKTQEHYGLLEMIIWSSLPYFIWQTAYHFLITVRRADKIRAGRPTSFTWLRHSYSKTTIGKLVLKLPNALQEYAFMGIQYIYALTTMLPCPLWFYNRYASAAFISAVALWSVYNGATYYIDVFGTRFQRELEQLKRDTIRWQTTASASSSGEMGAGERPEQTVDVEGVKDGEKKSEGELRQRMVGMKSESEPVIQGVVEE